MRRVSSEYLKLFLNKIFVVCLCVAFIANSMFLVMTQSEDTENSVISSSVEVYEELIDECEKSENKEKILAIFICLCKHSKNISKLGIYVQLFLLGCKLFQE